MPVNMDSGIIDTMKIKIGIIFGGSSREREISFAGGRTVYDNLNKSLFEAVPIFVVKLGVPVQRKYS
jgi:D-alanine-D-alanine ligase-like ATP-grasp enzyme